MPGVPWADTPGQGWELYKGFMEEVDMWGLARGRAWHGQWGPACTGPQVPSLAAGAGGRKKLERKAEAELCRALWVSKKFVPS